ncbi:hypothetical protein CEXT_759031 [Caerostris extrusa]|uniref:Uncharacterized protein n=1 Tax=Caerostris extrusa TaxID=172846 RepID=A0AAV4NNG5_CAEEX|nr:hypothetical protein CEXT_759031 [Caerostris extrusa]
MLETIREYITDLHSSICTFVRDILTVGLLSQRPRQLKILTISNSLSVMKNFRKSKKCNDEGSRAIAFLITKTDGSDNLDFVKVPPETCLSKERYLVICAYRASMRVMYIYVIVLRLRMLSMSEHVVKDTLLNLKISIQILAFKNQLRLLFIFN